jgi:hypothetical protein
LKSSIWIYIEASISIVSHFNDSGTCFGLDSLIAFDRVPVYQYFIFFF